MFLGPHTLCAPLIPASVSAGDGGELRGERRLQSPACLSQGSEGGLFLHGGRGQATYLGTGRGPQRGSSSVCVGGVTVPWGKRQGRDSPARIFLWPLGLQGMPALTMAGAPRDSPWAPLPSAFSNQPSCSPQTVAAPCVMRSLKEDCGGGDPTWPGNISQTDLNTLIPCYLPGPGQREDAGIKQGCPASCTPSRTKERRP